MPPSRRTSLALSLCLYALCICTLCARSLPPALADDTPSLDVLSNRAANLSSSLDAIRSQYQGAQDPNADPNARLQEGLILLELGDPHRASAVFLDLATDDALSNHPAHRRAFFLLGRSLYDAHHHLTARRWLKRALDDGPPEDRPQAAALFIDLALRDKRALSQSDWEDIERIYQLAASSHASHPELTYARGKALYARAQFEAAQQLPSAPQTLSDAINALSSLPTDSPTGLAARYFAGACRVQAQDLDGALSDFQTVIDASPSVPAPTPTFATQNADVTELAYIARARIFYERQQWTDALDAYARVPRTSRHFDQVLFEIAWLHIAQKDLPMALRHIDILLLSNPDSVFMPDAKRLRADLLKTQGDFSKAIDTYEELLNTFDPILASLHAMVEGHPNPLTYFQNLAASSSLSGDTFSYLPPEATQWLPPDERMLAAIDMVSSLAESHQNAEEVQLLIREIEAAISNEHRYRLLPGLRDPWLNVLSLENALLSLHRDLNAIEASLLPQISPQANAAALTRLDAEGRFLSFPQDREDFARRAQDLSNALQTQRLRAFRLRSLIESAEAKVTAIDQWARLHAPSANLTAQQETDLHAGLASAHADIASLSAELREVEHQIRILDSLGSLDAELVAREDAIRQTFRAAVLRERDALSASRAGSSSADLSRIDALRADLDRADASLSSLKNQLTSTAQAKIADVQRRLDAERALLPEYASSDARLRDDVRDVAGSVAHQNWLSAIALFSDLVLASDMGVINVAWLKKEATSDKLNRLKEERSRENDVLRQDFEQVLRESGQSSP